MVNRALYVGEDKFTHGTHLVEFEPLDLKAQTSGDTKK